MVVMILVILLWRSGFFNSLVSLGEVVFSLVLRAGVGRWHGCRHIGMVVAVAIM